ncbi:MAG: hypothetical protein RMM58_01300 [Chloroflexota bacterium]|nr:hypothetical protein [Dehalococcoidia bacterium]MDW8252495.1 hypothetical protein [Chloroflexota bacterium]
MSMPSLHPYQREPLRAILRSVLRREGHTFSIMMSRQAGKNELSAQLEVGLLVRFAARGGDGVKASPTFRPQTLTSLARLIARLRDAGLGQLWVPEYGQTVRLGRARMRFFSAAPSANVVGATASLILEIDEAQAVDAEKYQKDFRPMAAAANATTVLYGTAWDGATLLERAKEEHLALERRDGIRRHFEYDWETVAAVNPDYRRFVEAERARLGEDHPLFRTQYALRPLAGDGRAFPPAALDALRGDHPLQTAPTPGRRYVAGIDLAGEAETEEARPSRRDSTVVVIGEVVAADTPPGLDGLRAAAFPPRLRVVHLRIWTGERHAALFAQLVRLLREWEVARVVVDATGVGAGVASFLRDTLGARVEPFHFTAASKSDLAFRLLAAVPAGRLALPAGDAPELRRAWREIALARTASRPNGLLALFVDPAEGHDDVLMALALALYAAEEARPRAARGRTGISALPSAQP